MPCQITTAGETADVELFTTALKIRALGSQWMSRKLIFKGHLSPWLSPAQGCRCWGRTRGQDGTKWRRLPRSPKQHRIAAVGKGVLTCRAIPMLICHLEKVLDLSLFPCLFCVFWEGRRPYEFELRKSVLRLFSQVLEKYQCNDNVEEKKSHPSFPTLLVSSLANNHTDSALVQTVAFEELNEISMIWTNTSAISLQCA